MTKKSIIIILIVAAALLISYLFSTRSEAPTVPSSQDIAEPGSKVHDVEGALRVEADLREAACPEPALACEVPTTPVCRNGKWICVGPASPAE